MGTILNVLFMNLVLSWSAVGPFLVFLLLLRIQRILKGNSDSVWSRWFWSFCFKIISLCHRQAMSQPVWSVHVLLIQQSECWPGHVWEEGVLWRSLFFAEEGRGCSSARTLPRAGGIPGVILAVLWFTPLCGAVRAICPCPQSFPGGSPGSLLMAQLTGAGKGDLGAIKAVQGGEEDLLLLWGMTVIICDRKGALRHQGKLKMYLLIHVRGDSQPTQGFEWSFSLSHWAVLQLLLSLIAARIPKFSKHQLTGRIWRRKLFFSTQELGFCGSLHVVWCWLQVCEEDPEGEVEGGGSVEGRRTFMAPQHSWPQSSLDLSCCYPPQTSLVQDIKLSCNSWEETAGII